MRAGLRLELMISGSILAAFLPNPAHAILGTEMVPLMQLVAGQVSELESLAQQIGATQEQTGLLVDLNTGVNKVVNQIESLERIIERTQGLNPSSAQSLASLNDLMRRARTTQEDVMALMQIRTEVADQAIAQSALQSDTAYRMGQEMVATGSELARESKTASPGRAAQISASADAAQMLSQGVELQTLAHIAELQALSLDFQKAQATQVASESDQRKKAFESALNGQVKKRGPR